MATVRSSGDALLVIINDILDFSKIEAGELELEQVVFDLPESIESSLDVLAGTAVAKGLELVGEVDPTCAPRVVGDPMRLRQILVNLLSNAVKFTEQGDVVLTVRTEPRPGGQVAVIVDVADTGIGIPADRMNRLFQSFSQVDASTTRLHGGTGLGLAISRRLAQAMGGDIRVRSELGAGSVFTLTVVLPTATATAPADPPAPVDLAGRSVLLVAGSTALRRALRSQLTAWSLAVTDPGSAVEALALVRSGIRYDVGILDVPPSRPDKREPVDSGGDELANAVRRCPAGARLPLVLLTGLGTRPGPTAEPAAAAVVTKPIRTAALRHAVAQALGLAAPSTRVPAPRSGSPGRDPAAGRSLHVLLAEDNLTNQTVGRLLLTKLGHRVDVVGDGRQAVESLRRIAYDVVLMDLQMPDMDGLQASRRIRADLPPERQAHIIALTASVSAQDRAACVAAGMDDYLAKPVRATDLEAVLRAVPVRAAPAHPAEDRSTEAAAAQARG